MYASQRYFIIRLIGNCVTLANWAGKEIRHITHASRYAPSKLEVVDKGNRDFQTKADRLVQRLIVVNLKKIFPEATIVGEEDLPVDEEEDSRLETHFLSCHTTGPEPAIQKMPIPPGFGYENLTAKDITIWVDPLDGTAEYVEGKVTHVTVLIGISVKGSVIAGVINQPFDSDDVSPNVDGHKGRTIWGLVGLGCFGVAPKKPLENSEFNIVTTKSHGNKNIEDTIAAIKPDKVTRIGGAGYKVLKIIEGEAQSYVFPSNGCKRWDTAAPEAILKASGGKLTDILGNPIEYNYRPDNDYQNYLGVIASVDEASHSKVIESIPDHVKNQLLELQKQNLKPKC